MSLFFFRNYEDVILKIFPVYSDRKRQSSMYVNGKFTDTFISNFTAHIMKITGEDLEIHALDSFYNSLLKDVSNYSSKTDYNRTVEYIHNTIYDIYRQFEPEFESVLRHYVKDNFANTISINNNLLDRLSSPLNYRYKKFQRFHVVFNNKVSMSYDTYYVFFDKYLELLNDLDISFNYNNLQDMFLKRYYSVCDEYFSVLKDMCVELKCLNFMDKKIVQFFIDFHHKVKIHYIYYDFSDMVINHFNFGSKFKGLLDLSKIKTEISVSDTVISQFESFFKEFEKSRIIEFTKYKRELENISYVINKTKFEVLTNIDNIGFHMFGDFIGNVIVPKYPNKFINNLGETEFNQLVSDLEIKFAILSTNYSKDKIINDRLVKVYSHYTNEIVSDTSRIKGVTTISDGTQYLTCDQFIKMPYKELLEIYKKSAKENNPTSLKFRKVYLKDKPQRIKIIKEHQLKF